jgi:CheY-like chemotaxis protein
VIEELRERFRDRFIDTARQRLSRGLSALDGAGDAHAVRHELHALAGEASILGLDAMSRTARDGEQAAKVWEQQADAESRLATSRAVQTLLYQLDAFAAGGPGGGRAARPTSPPGYKRRVLVIDESLVTAEQLCDELDAEGMETRAVSSIEAALDAMGEFRPHLVATDVNLPGGDVASACGRLRAAIPGRQVSIVLVSNLAREALERLGREVAADAFASRLTGLPGVVESIVSALDKEASA